MLSRYAKNLHHLIWIAIVFALYGAIFYISLPPQFESRGILLTDEIILITLSIVIYFVIKQPNWEWKYVGSFLSLFVFALPLLRLWETAESDWNIILGLLPWADAEGYYADANRLLDGRLFSAFSGRRPLFASLLAVLLELTNHNLQLVAIVFAAINGLAVFLFALEIQRNLGSAAAAAAIYIAQLFYRPYVGTMLTEQFGLPLGLLAFVVLIRGVTKPGRFLFATGLFLLTLSLFVRAGAFFILLMLPIYGIYFFVKRGNSITTLAVVFTVAMALALILNRWFGGIIALPGSVQFGNFAETLYGQAVGGQRWTQVAIDHPELGALKEPDRSRAVYRLAFREIINNPFGLVKGSLKALKDFIVPSSFSAFSFLKFGNGNLDLIFRTAAFLVFLTGLWMSWQCRHDSFFAFTLASTLGVFFSIPFLPPIDAGIRPYAATMAAIFLPVLVVVCRLSGERLADSPSAYTRTAVLAASYGLCLIFAALMGGFILRFTNPDMFAPTINCPSGFVSANIRVTPGSYVQLVESNSTKKTHVPIVLLKDVLQSFDEFPYGDFASILRKIKHPTLITLTNDLLTGKQMWVIAPLELADTQGRIVSVCGESISSQYLVIQVGRIETP